MPDIAIFSNHRQTTRKYRKFEFDRTRNEEIVKN